MIDPSLWPLVEEQRAYLAEHGDHPADADPGLLLPVEVRNVGGVPVRILRPAQPRAVGTIVVSVDYRLIPGVSYPAPIDDGETVALRLVRERLFGDLPLLIGGESVGATISMLVLLRLRDVQGLRGVFRAMNLNVGNYDFSMTPSQRQAPDHYFLSPAALRRTQATVFPGLSAEELRSPEISSLYADVSDLPPALLSVGTADSVLDDSLFLAARLQAAGGRAQLEVYPEATHPFMTLPTAMAAEARRRTVMFLNAACGVKASIS
jgi:acetyl esterase/lipase